MNNRNIKTLCRKSFVTLCVMLFSYAGFCQDGEVVTDSLVTLGFENVCWGENEAERVYVIENIAYRLNGVGIGKAIDVIQNIGMPSGKGCRLIVLDNNVPKISLYCGLKAETEGEVEIKRSDWDVSYDLGESWELVKKQKKKNSSLFKVDIVVYPEFSFRNIKLSRMYDFLINLSPAVEVSLWKGSKLSAQLVIPIVNDYGYKYDSVRPGIISLSQTFRLPYNIFVTGTVGFFSNNRWGGDIEADYHFKNERFYLDARVSYTGFGMWGEFKNNVNIHPFKYGCTTEDMRVTFSIGGGYYWAKYNTQVAVHAERYLLGEYGGRLDVIRHFKYCSIGLYGMLVQYAGNKGINGGFRFQVNLPPYRYKRTKHIPRVLPSRNMGFAYNAGNEFVYGKGFKAQASNNIAEDNRFNPLFIKQQLLNF